MQTFWLLIRRRAALVLLATAALAAGACGLDKQAAPPLSGPSEFSLSLSLSASPETLTQDGRSVSVITAQARDVAGQPVPNVTILWRGDASTSRAMPVTLSAASSVTDANGLASVVLFSPPAPTEAPAVSDTITVTATPSRGNVANVSAPRFIVVTLRPVPGTQLRNNPPVPVISASTQAPIVGQEVLFNGRLSTDEGEICLSRCTYEWNFGDGRTDRGLDVRHTFTEPSGTDPYTVTLTVTDERAGTASTTLELTAVPNAAVPVARFTVTPSNPVRGELVSFDASDSTASSGAVVRTYTWDFGDGNTETSGSPRTQHTYDEAKDSFHVTLTVTDSNGRTSQRVAQNVRVTE